MVERLLSRKFWLAIVGAGALFFVHAYDQVAQIVIAYLAVQAAVDFGTAWQSNSTTAPAPEVPHAAEGGDDEEVSGWTGSVI